MKELNKYFFIDIEECLVSSINKKSRIIGITDWKFNDFVLNYLIKKEINHICIVANRPNYLIINRKTYERFIYFVQEQLIKIINKGIDNRKRKVYINVLYNNTKDSYCNYPNPGNIFNFCIEHDVDLSESTYLSSDDYVLEKSCVGIKYVYSKFIISEI